ncbi:hypothetical protein Tco_1511843 [Tanacetum coccineum]
MVLAPGQPIPHGRPYRYHLNRLIHMMNARKRVRPLPTHCLVVRHSVHYSSLDHFSLDDSSRDSSSSSSSETSSDSSADALSDSASSRSSSDHSIPTPSLDHLMILLLRVILAKGIDPLLHPIDHLMSYARADLLPSPKRIRSPESAQDEVVEVTYERSRRVVVEAIDQEEIETGVRGLFEVRVDRVTHPVVAEDIPEPAQEGVVEVTYKTLGDLVQRFHDHTEEILVHRVQVTESIQRDHGYKIVATGQQSADILERIRELERDNRRLRDMMDVASQRVTRS